QSFLRYLISRRLKPVADLQIIEITHAHLRFSRYKAAPASQNRKSPRRLSDQVLLATNHFSPITNSRCKKRAISSVVEHLVYTEFRRSVVRRTVFPGKVDRKRSYITLSQIIS